jgi:hypothetical protein
MELSFKPFKLKLLTYYSKLLTYYKVVKFSYGLTSRIAIMSEGNYPTKYANIMLAIYHTQIGNSTILCTEVYSQVFCAYHCIQRSLRDFCGAAVAVATTRQCHMQ